MVGGGGDQAASAIGNGIVETGAVSCTVGTSGVVFAYLDKPAYDERAAFTRSAMPYRIHGT